MACTGGGWNRARTPRLDWLVLQQIMELARSKVPNRQLAHNLSERNTRKRLPVTRTISDGSTANGQLRQPSEQKAKGRPVWSPRLDRVVLQQVEIRIITNPFSRLRERRDCLIESLLRILRCSSSY